jgi:hypothetical protein
MEKGSCMKKLSLLVAGLAVLMSVPASAETVVIKKRHGAHHGVRAEMPRHHGGQYGMRSHEPNRAVVVKQRRHYSY